LAELVIVRKSIRKKTFTSSLKKHKGLLFLTIPGLLYFIVFCYIPMYGVSLAFKEFDVAKGIWTSPYVGLKHFEMLFRMQDVWVAVRNTIWISFLNLLFGFPAPIILALLLNELGNLKFKKVVQTISYLPNFLSWVVIAGLMFILLNVDTGVVTVIFKKLGLEPISFLTSRTLFRPLLVASNLWKSVGWGSIIFLATLAGIDQGQYEAAIIDGAGRFKRILYISLPGMLPVITIMLIMSSTSLIHSNFDQIFNLYNPLVYEVADVIDTYVYRTGIGSFRYEFATAVGLLRNLVGLIILILVNTTVKRVSEYAIW